MEPKRKSKSAAVFKFLGILCILFLLFLNLTTISLVRRDTPKSTADAPSSALLDGRKVAAEQDYRLKAVPSFAMFSMKDSPLTRMFYPSAPHYYFGWFPDSYGDPYCCVICVYGDSDLYKRLQAYEADENMPLSDVVRESYYTVEDVAAITPVLQKKYAEALAWFKTAYGDSFGDGRQPADSGKLFTYLGDTAEDFVTLKKATVKHKWGAVAVLEFVLLLPPIVLFFVLSVVQKRQFNKRLAAAQAAAPYGPAEGLPPDAAPTPAFGAPEAAGPMPAASEAAIHAPDLPEAAVHAPDLPEAADPARQ